MMGMPCVPVSSAVARVLTCRSRVTIEAKAYRAIWEWSVFSLRRKPSWRRVY